MKLEAENLTNEEIISKARMYESNIKAMKADITRLTQERGIPIASIYRFNNEENSGK